VVTTFTLNAFGDKVAMATKLNTTKYEYDRLGRLRTTIESAEHLVRYEYDANNNQTKVRDQVIPLYYDSKQEVQKSSKFRESVYETRYDALDRRMITIDYYGKSTTYVYDAASRLIRVIDRVTGNGADNLLLHRRREYQYDQLNRLTRDIWQDDFANTKSVEVKRQAYTYDALDNLLLSSQLITLDGQESIIDATWREGTFDGLNRLRTERTNLGTRKIGRIRRSNTSPGVGSAAVTAEGNEAAMTTAHMTLRMTDRSRV